MKILVWQNLLIKIPTSRMSSNQIMGNDNLYKIIAIAKSFIYPNIQYKTCVELTLTQTIQ